VTALARPGDAPASRRQLVVASVLVAVITAVTGCGSDKADESDATTTTAVAPASSDSSSTTAGSEAEVTTTAPTPVDPAAFQSTLTGLMGKLDDADGDICKLIEVLDSAGAAGNPTTKEDAAAAAAFLGSAYGKLADAAPSELADDAAVIRDAAKSMTAEPNSPDFDLNEFTTKGPSAFRDDKFLKASSKFFQAVSSKCGDDSGG